MLDRNKKFHVLFNSGEQGIYDDINDLFDAIKCHRTCIHNSYDTVEEANLRISQFNDDFDDRKGYCLLAYKYMYYSLEYEMLLNKIKDKFKEEFDIHKVSVSHRFSIRKIPLLENLFSDKEDNLFLSEREPDLIRYSEDVCDDFKEFWDNTNNLIIERDLIEKSRNKYGSVIGENEHFCYKLMYKYQKNGEKNALLACFFNGERFEDLDILYKIIEKKEIAYYVYLIYSENKLKIGFSKNPKNRLNSIKTQNPKSYVMYTIKVEEPTEIAARIYEKKLHKKFAHLRIGGEWFEWDDSIYQYFKKRKYIIKY
jgi:hypothetical protein